MKANEVNLRIYEITHRTTGEQRFVPHVNAEDACKQIGWPVGDCYINPVKPRRHLTPHNGFQSLVEIPCVTCPFQYAECKKPIDQECPTRPSAPELQNWLLQATEAHLCGFVGDELAKKDHEKVRKWVKMEDAVKALTPH